VTLLGSVLSERRSGGSTLAGLLRGDGRGSRATAGVPVTADTAMAHSAWWRCVDLISGLVSTMPVVELERTLDARVPVEEPDPIISSPSLELGSIMWRRQVVTSWLTRGNAYGWVTAVDGFGLPTTIEILDPDTVSFRKEDGRAGPYSFYVLGQPVERWPAGRLWHRPAYTPPGSSVGLSPVSYAAAAIGLGLAARSYGSEFFADGGHPTGVLETDQRLDGPEGDRVAERVKARYRQARADGGPLVTGAGLRYRTMQMSPTEAQFLETIRANRTDVANFFGVDPGFVGGETGNSRTYANVEARSLDVLTYTVAPWVFLLEESLSELVRAGRTVKLNTDVIVRVDYATRMRGHDTAIRAGWRSRNEVRRIEDEAPIRDDDGDAYLWPPYRGFPLPDELGGASEKET
jgi:HK97 family phage portal protein